MAWRLELPPARNGGALAGLRVATWFEDPYVPVDRDSRVALDAAAAALAEAGAGVTAVQPPAGLEELVDLWARLVLPILFAGADKDTFAGFAAAADGTPVTEGEDDTMRRLRAITARHRDWLAANEHRQRLRARFADFFADHDVLLAPVMPTAAFPHDTERDMLARPSWSTASSAPTSTASGGTEPSARCCSRWRSHRWAARPTASPSGSR